MAAGGTIKEGYLFKKGRINTDWRERLFVLNARQLAYFKGGVSYGKAQAFAVSLTSTVHFFEVVLLRCACSGVHALVYICKLY